MPAKVDILLATYNGARHLRAQLASIENQDWEEWKLLIRDDGSNDSTCEILLEFEARHPSKVCILNDTHKRLGPIGNFSRLLEASSSDYALFCDQDDLWDSDKISKLMARIPQGHSPNRPLLIHSDLRLIDENDELIESSFWKYQYINPDHCVWPRLLIQNGITGCATLFNAALKRQAMPIPPGVVMHDWWFALIAACNGTIVCVHEPTLSYRQHPKNTIGAKRHSLIATINSCRNKGWLKEKARIFEITRLQARCLAECKNPQLDTQHRDAGRLLADINRVNWALRFCRLRRLGILKTGFIRNAGLALRTCFARELPTTTKSTE